MELPAGTSAGCWLPSTGEGLSARISSILHSVCPGQDTRVWAEQMSTETS